MNKEQILNVMDHIDPALIEGADGRNSKKRLPPIARTGLVAACLCAALVGTAFAVETVTGVSIREYFAKEEFEAVMQRLDPDFQASEEDAFCGYVIERTDEGVLLESVSDEVLTFSQTQLAAGEVPCKEFSSLEELEAFLGMSLYDNPVLEQVTELEYQRPELYEDGCLDRVTFQSSRGANLMCSSDEEGLIYFAVSDYYASSDGRVSAYVAAEAFRGGYDAGECAYLYPDGTVLTQEEYVTDRGEAVTIIRCDYPESEWSGAYTAHVAHFYVDGVRYYVNVETRQVSGEGSSVLKDILNGFEFKEIS